MNLAWGAKVSPEFAARVVAICGRLGIADPSWLMACMAFESGRTFSPSVRNAAGSGATGLIQFMPSTARGLGTTVDELAAMTAEEQLEWVERYFRPYAGRMNSLDDVYMAILWPKAIGWFLHTPLFSAADVASKAYVQNRGLDVNADGVVTKGEATAHVQRALDEGLRPGNVAEIGAAAAIPTPEPSTPAPPEIVPQTPDFGVPASVPEESPMPAMLATLLPSVLQLFAPRAQAVLGKVTGQPADVLQPFLQSLFAQIGQVTQIGEVRTDAQAIAAVAELQKLKEANSALVDQVQNHALDYLDKLAPLFDRLAAADAAENAAALAGRNAAMERAIRDPYDVAPAMVKNVTSTSNWLLGGLVVATVVAMALKAVFPEVPDYVSMLLPVLGLLAGQISKERGAIIGYRFDGTPSSNASSAINSQIVQAGNIQAARK